MEFTKIKKLIKLEAERIFPTENYILQELWIKEDTMNAQVPFFCFSQNDFDTILMSGFGDIDLHYNIETIPNQEMSNIIEDYILLGFSCFSIRG